MFYTNILIIIALFASNMSLCADSPEHRRPYADQHLELLLDKDKLEWGGLGPNCARGAGTDLTNSCEIASKDTLTIGFQAASADSDLEGSFYKQDEFNKRYPRFAALFKEKFKQIKIGHVGFLMYDFPSFGEALDAMSSADFLTMGDKEKGALLDRVVLDLKPQIDTLRGGGEFIYQTFICSFDDLLKGTALKPTILPRQKYLGNNSLEINYKPALEQEGQSVTRYETAFDISDKASHITELGWYSYVFTRLGLTDFSIKLVIASDIFSGPLSIDRLKKQSIGSKAYLQVSGTKKTLDACSNLKCAHKESANKFDRCAKCMQAKYCSRECQKTHWPIHKITCAK